MRNFCVLCGCERENFNWKYKTWFTQKGDCKGWGCGLHFSHKPIELVPQYVKDDRKKYANDMVQRFREGELSREFVELYPGQVRAMVKEGVVTPDEVRKSKYVWRGDDPNIRYKPQVSVDEVASVGESDKI